MHILVVEALLNLWGLSGRERKSIYSWCLPLFAATLPRLTRDDVTTCRLTGHALPALLGLTQECGRFTTPETFHGHAVILTKAIAFTETPGSAVSEHLSRSAVWWDHMVATFYEQWDWSPLLLEVVRTQIAHTDREQASFLTVCR